MIISVLALIFAAEIDPNTLLERVAARYSELKSFSLEVRQNQQRGVRSETSRIRLDVGAGKRYFYREARAVGTLGQEFAPVTVFSDGESVWRDDGHASKPTEDELGLMADRQAREAIKGLHQRFAMLDGAAMNARFVKAERLRGHTCAIVEIESRLKSAPAQWKEKLWIDTESATIVRSHFTTVSNLDGSKTTMISDYLVPPGERPVEESLFHAKPGAGNGQ